MTWADDEDSANVVDVVALGNMCVDVLLPASDPLPAATQLASEAFMTELADGTDESHWEVGGNCNFLIAASRIGLRAECVGHVGEDEAGAFLSRALAEANVPLRRLASPAAVARAAAAAARTLLCLVFTDGKGGHAFCSRYDLGPWPLLADVQDVDDEAARALAKCKAVFVNGFVFDELKPSAVLAALSLAKANGASVFFDPGPRAHTFLSGPERSAALDTVLGAADVVIATTEEAAALTGADPTAVEGAMAPALVARAVFDRPGCAAKWVVVKRGAEGAAIFTRRGDQVYAGAIDVEVRDTVGCGDAAAAAFVLGYLKIDAKRRKLFEASSGKIAYLPNGTLADMMEETLTLAAAVGAATATEVGAGRKVANADKVRELLEACADADEEEGKRRGINPKAAKRARSLMNDMIRFGM